MYNSILSTFDNNALIWIYGFSKKLSGNDKKVVADALDHFVKSWKSHGDDVAGAFSLIYGRFVILAAKSSGVSGCSVDSSIHIFKELRNKNALDALNLNLVFYRVDEEIESVPRTEFSNMVKAGKISLETTVFDTSILSISQLREGKFELPVKNSWHVNLIRKVA